MEIEDIFFQVDCTYGSGSTIEGLFVHKFDPVYFFPAPEQLILTHWVEDERFQLLELPATLSDLEHLVTPSLKIMSLGIVPVIQSQFINLPPDIYTTKICLQCKTNFVFTAQLRPADSNSANDCFAKPAGSWVYVEQTGNNEDIDINIIIPKAGIYSLEIFYKEDRRDRSSKKCISYIISSQTDPEDLEYIGFPEIDYCTAAKCGFSIVSLKEDETQPKHMLKSKSSFQMKIKLEAQDTKISIFLVKGEKSELNISQHFKCLTKLHASENKPQHFTLHIIFPSQGWWTLFISDGNRNCIMKYQLYATKYMLNSVYPSTTNAAPDMEISVFDDKTCSVKNSNPSTGNMNDHQFIYVYFKASYELHYLTKLIEINENGCDLGNNAPEHFIFLLLNKCTNVHEISAVLPPGIWSLRLYANHHESSTLKRVLCAEPLYGPSNMPQVAYPIINHKQYKLHGLSFEQKSIPYSVTCDTGLFQFPFHAPHYLCYSFNLKEENSDTNELGGYALISKPEKSYSDKCEVNVIVPRRGNWKLSVFTQTRKLLNEGSKYNHFFDLNFSANFSDSNKIFPKIEQQFMIMYFLPPYNIKKWFLPHVIEQGNYPHRIDIPFIQLSEEVELHTSVKHNDANYTENITRLKESKENNEIIRSFSLTIPQKGKWVFIVNARYLDEMKHDVYPILSYTVEGY